MRFWLFTIAITLSSFAIVAVVMSLLISFASAAIARGLDRYSPQSRAKTLFRVRMLPVVTASFVAFGIALPVFVIYEPRDSDEALARTLVVLGAAGAALVVRGLCRALASWRVTNDVRREWLSRARPIPGIRSPLPLFAIDEPFPTVAVVGITDPMLFVSERVLRECTADEVGVMLRHEAAHVTVRDNLKRFLIRASPDVVSAGGAIDRAWSSAAEEAADAAAIAGRPADAFELAEALIRVARLAAPRTPELASAFYPGGSIESRVRRLMSPEPAPDAPVAFGGMLLLGAAAAFVALVFAGAPVLHQAIELVVSRLP